MATTVLTWLLPMNFSTRLVQIRKSRGLTQQALADAAGLHINQIRRYETGSAQPALEGLRRRTKHYPGIAGRHDRQIRGAALDKPHCTPSHAT